MEESDPTAQGGDDRCPQCHHEVGGAWLVCAWCGLQLAAPAELAAGTRLGEDRYQILRVIGRGGFGITYDVGDRRLERRVAMKELFPESAVRHGSLVLTPPQGRAGFKAARERFLREARVLARFTHPGIVRVYEVFEEHGTAYLVMELLEGRTLIELLQQRGRAFPEAEVLDVAGRVAAALRPVHAAGVLHRDVNPSNVMMTHHGRIVVIDFGLARDYDEGQTVGMTRVVTPGYAPLEQYRGEGRFGPSTDVYGLAATCYRLATGKVPVSALERDGGALLPSPRSINPAISKPVSDAILDGLELEPQHRPQDLDSFLARLGVSRLPDGPRSLLLDTVPAPVPERPLSAADVRPLDRPDRAAAFAAHRSGPVTGATEIVARPSGRNAEPGPVGSVGPVTGPTELAPRHPARVGPMADPDATRAPSAGAGDRTDATTWAAGGPTGDATRGDGTRSDATRTDATRGDATRGDATRGDATRTAGASESAGGGGGPGSASAGRGYVLPAPPPTGPPTGAADGVPRARMPLAIGPHRAGRRKVTVPLTVAAVAAGSAAPVLVTAVVVIAALPTLATLGDSEAHRLRTHHGVAGGWAERRLAPGALAPARFLRNVAASILRASPMIGIGAVLVAGWYGLEQLSVPRLVLDLTLRAIGVLVVGVVVVNSREGSARFRTGLGLDRLIERLAPGGRTTERVVIGWLLAGLLVAGSLWLAPAPFPLP